ARGVRGGSHSTDAGSAQPTSDSPRSAARNGAPSIVAQLEQRAADVVSGPPEASGGSVLASSLSVRRVEAEEALVDLQSGGLPAILIGRGNGAEFPSFLPIVDPTTRSGYHHQIHITWISVLYRNGLIGLLIVIGLVVFALRAAWRGAASSLNDEHNQRLTFGVPAIWILASTV